MIRIQLENQESFDYVLRRFQKTCQREGVISEIRRREYFEKPSESRRRQDRERLRNIRKIERLRGYLRPKSDERPKGGSPRQRGRTSARTGRGRYASRGPRTTSR